MIDYLINLLFPKTCLNCGSRDLGHGAICQKCFLKIEINKTLFCGQCLARLPEGRKICHSNYPYLLGAAGNYGDDILRKAILSLKFNGVRDAAPSLAEVLVSYAKELDFKWDQSLVIPVPLSRQRERERGFNQSQIIAEIFASKTKAHLTLNNLIRIHHTKPQNELSDYRARSENIKGAFVVRDGSRLNQATIVLIDDVVTSGSTFKESARVLKGAGVKKVLALAVAKA